MNSTILSKEITQQVTIPVAKARLHGELSIPEGAEGLVLFVHGSGSSRHSPRNQFVARIIREAGLGTLLFDLLTSVEELEDEVTRGFRFNIPLLADRLIVASQWVSRQNAAANLRLGFFGSSTGAAAALIAAAELGKTVNAIVSRGGRPDLAKAVLPVVTAPTLLIVGEQDDVVLNLNEQAFALLKCEKRLAVIPDATHLFQEEGALERVATLAADWFQTHLHAKAT